MRRAGWGGEVSVVFKSLNEGGIIKEVFFGFGLSLSSA
jgi:hypothetical protein